MQLFSNLNVNLFINHNQINMFKKEIWSRRQDFDVGLIQIKLNWILSEIEQSNIKKLNGVDKLSPTTSPYFFYIWLKQGFDNNFCINIQEQVCKVVMVEEMQTF